MKISLIIPAFNEEKWIGECLDYAIHNSHNNFHEILVIDNASIDATRRTAEAFAAAHPQANIRVITELKKGVQNARQRGFEESTGEILAYIDADTRMPEGWYEQIERMYTNSSLAALSGPYRYYDVGAWQAFSVRVWYVFAKLLYRCVGYMITGGNFAIRRDVLERMGGMDTSIDFYGDDTDIARRAHQYGRVVFDMNFVMETSGRRLADQGFFRTSYIYAVNYLSQAFIRRPVTKKHENFR